MATNLETYVPPSVEPGCGGSIFNPAPCTAPGELSLETIFDLIQTPVLGVILGLVIYFQFRKLEGIKRPGLWALGVGIVSTVMYGAGKFVF